MMMIRVVFDIVSPPAGILDQEIGQVASRFRPRRSGRRAERPTSGG